MREQALRYIQRHEMARPGDRVLVAVSGGADSVALLRVLLDSRAELGIILAVAHFHHGLRGDAADADERFVRALAQSYDLEFFVGRGDVSEHARLSNTSLEAAGREQRYNWLATVALQHHFDAVATAHTSDDQAETVLFRFLRGTGTKGLGGIHPVLLWKDPASVRFIRPLLTTRRTEVERYLTELGQGWREDESNLNQRFRRNRIRHQLLPLLERDYNVNTRQAMNETAEIARGEEAYWDALLGSMLGTMYDSPGRLRLFGFGTLHVALQRRLLKFFLEDQGVDITFRHVERARSCALGQIHSCELPGGSVLRREGEYLHLLRASCPPKPPVAYHFSLAVPGEVCADGLLIRAVPVAAQFAAEEIPGTLLRADLLPQSLKVRNWQPGDRYHPAHSRTPEKLKRLFAEKRIPAEQRATWPVVLNNDSIVWVRGFPVAESYQWRSGEGGDAIRIETVTRSANAKHPVQGGDGMQPNLEWLREFAARYTAAWGSKNPADVAGFYSPGGSLTVNAGAPAVGRDAISRVANSFMTDFPDLQVTMDRLVIVDDRPRYHWTLFGTNSGPGGTGHSVRISGFEVWEMGPDGLIASSQGRFDAADYERQLHGATQREG